MKKENLKTVVVKMTEFNLAKVKEELLKLVNNDVDVVILLREHIECKHRTIFEHGDFNIFYKISGRYYFGTENFYINVPEYIFSEFVEHYLTEQINLSTN